MTPPKSEAWRPSEAQEWMLRAALRGPVRRLADGTWGPGIPPNVMWACVNREWLLVSGKKLSERLGEDIVSEVILSQGGAEVVRRLDAEAAPSRRVVQACGLCGHVAGAHGEGHLCAECGMLGVEVPCDRRRSEVEAQEVERWTEI